MNFLNLHNKIKIFRKNHSDTSEEDNLWKRNLLLLSVAQFIAMVGMNGLVPFLPLFVVDLGVKDPTEAKMWSSLIFAGPYILSVFAVPIWGMLGDRYGQKKMVIRAIFGLGLAVFLMGFSQNVQQLFALRILQGATSGFIAAALAFVTKNSPRNRSGYSIGIMQSASSAGIIIGPFFGGILSDLSGIRSVFIIVAGLCIVSALLIIFFLIEKKHAEQPEKTSVWQNLKFINARRDMKKLIAFIIVTQMAVLFSNPIFPFYVARLGAPKELLSTITGLLIAVVGIFSIMFAPYWGRRNDKESYTKILAVASLFAGIGSLLHMVAPNYLWLFPVRGLIGIFFAAIAPTLYAALSYRSPDSNKGGIMGIASSANLFGALLSYLSCSLFVSYFDMIWTFAISGVMLVSVTIWIYVEDLLMKKNQIAE